MEDKFAIVTIERNDDAFLLSCPPDHGLIRRSRRILRDGNNILARFPQRLDGRQRYVLVRE